MNKLSYWFFKPPIKMPACGTSSRSTCISNSFLRISPSVSFTFGMISFLTCSLVLLSLCFRKRKKVKSEKEMFVSLTQTAITCFFLNDLLNLLCYLPSQLFQIIFANYELLTRERLTLVWLGSQLSESLLIASGLWNLTIILCIYLSINAKTEETEENVLAEKELFYKTLFVLFGWGIPMVFAFIMCPINVRYQVWYKTPKDYLIAQFANNIVHSAFYILIVIVTLLLTFRVFLVIRSIPTYNIESSQKKNLFLYRLMLYTVPFIIIITVMTVRRIYLDSIRINSIIECESWDISLCLNMTAIVFHQIHIVLYSSRGTFNALVYAFLSDWFVAFYKRIFNK